MVDLVIACGYPNDAINAVHQTAVESLAAEYNVVGDGTRFNDRVPMLTRAAVQSPGERTGCSYVRPLLGYVRREVDRLVDRFLVVKYGETGTIRNGDYESEIREADPGPRARSGLPVPGTSRPVAGRGQESISESGEAT